MLHRRHAGAVDVAVDGGLDVRVLGGVHLVRFRIHEDVVGGEIPSGVDGIAEGERDDTGRDGSGVLDVEVRVGAGLVGVEGEDADEGGRELLCHKVSGGQLGFEPASRAR